MEKKPKTIDAPCGCAITSDEIDRISHLPDDILHYILSFVEIVEVVRLSVLSRRWKSLWITMPYLDFDIDRFCHQPLRLVPFNDGIYENFQEFINWVLMYQGSNQITRFRLSCGQLFFEEQSMRWIRDAARRNVKELELKFEYALKAFELPYCLITCESLWVLKLSLSWCVLRLPSYLKFKQLRSLHLELLELTDDDLTRRLFSECSFLEDLSLIDCIVEELTVLDISSASLKCLTMQSCSEYDYYGFCKTEIRISCPNLLSFTYIGKLARNYCLGSLSSLDNICIEIFPKADESCSKIEVGHLVGKILEQAENIRVLKLHDHVMWSLCHIIEELQSFSTTFRRLKFLNFSLEIDGCCTQGMFLLLKHCPNLESLTLVIEEMYVYTERNEQWQLHDEGNAYWESRLKSLQLINFKGREHELRFVKFMLENGLVLEKVIIIWSKLVEKSPVTDVTVLKFPKASSLVEVKIVP